MRVVPETVAGKWSAAVTFAIFFIGSVFSAASYGNSLYVAWHDARYVQVSDFQEAADAQRRLIVKDRRQDEYDDLDDEIDYLESTMAIKRASGTDTTIEELALHRAERKKQRLTQNLNTGI